MELLIPLFKLIFSTLLRFWPVEEFSWASEWASWVWWKLGTSVWQGQLHLRRRKEDTRPNMTLYSSRLKTVPAKSDALHSLYFATPLIFHKTEVRCTYRQCFMRRVHPVTIGLNSCSSYGDRSSTPVSKTTNPPAIRTCSALSHAPLHTDRATEPDPWEMKWNYTTLSLCSH
jgi:hypothetical protein